MKPLFNKSTVRTTRWVVFVCVASFVALPRATATLVPGLDLPALVDQADSIVVGRVIETRKLNSTTIAIQGSLVEANAMEAQVGVERILERTRGGPCANLQVFPTDRPDWIRGS